MSTDSTRLFYRYDKTSFFSNRILPITLVKRISRLSIRRYTPALEIFSMCAKSSGVSSSIVGLELVGIYFLKEQYSAVIEIPTGCTYSTIILIGNLSSSLGDKFICCWHIGGGQCFSTEYPTRCAIDHELEVNKIVRCVEKILCRDVGLKLL